MKIKLTLLSILLFTAFSIAQNNKHYITSGKVTYDVSYPESNLNKDQLESLPSESRLIFKNEKIKNEVSTSYGKTTIISDNSTGKGTMLMDAMGKKWQIAMNKDQIKKGKAGEKPEIILSRESKNIAGYNCSKANVTISFEGGMKMFEVWYTNEIKAKNNFSSQIEGINGFLMEYNTIQNGMSVKMVARKVEAKEIADSEFAIPVGYEVKTFDDLKRIGEGK